MVVGTTDRPRNTAINTVVRWCHVGMSFAIGSTGTSKKGHLTFLQLAFYLYCAHCQDGRAEANDTLLFVNESIVRTTTTAQITLMHSVQTCL